MRTFKGRYHVVGPANQSRARTPGPLHLTVLANAAWAESPVSRPGGEAASCLKFPAAGREFWCLLVAVQTHLATSALCNQRLRCWGRANGSRVPPGPGTAFVRQRGGCFVMTHAGPSGQVASINPCCETRGAGQHVLRQTHDAAPSRMRENITLGTWHYTKLGLTVHPHGKPSVGHASVSWSARRRSQGLRRAWTGAARLISVVCSVVSAVTRS